ncbi:MAG: response regulator transcription factor [Acidobacteria bacterium]|nr:response regulator transcription factor [Acidobacteriota bacterium]
MIRVALIGPTGLARTGMEALLARADDLEIVSDGPDVAIVFHRDADDSETEGTPYLVLVEDADSAAGALRDGARGVLPQNTTAEELAAAIRALASGLTVIAPEFVTALLSATPARQSNHETEALTPRELEVLRLLGRGLSNKEIAARLAISDHTAKFHVASVMSKLGAGSRTEAVTEGLRQGLILL